MTHDILEFAKPINFYIKLSSVRSWHIKMQVKPLHCDKACLQSLPYNPLSHILSFLDEDDGTSALITNKTFAKRVLPLFELAPELVVVNNSSNDHNKQVVQKIRHKFVRMPVEDPSTLLDRANTKRLYQRFRHVKSEKPYRRGMTTSQLAEYEHFILGLLCPCQYNQPSTAFDNVHEHWKQVLAKLPSTLELLRFRTNKNESLPYSRWSFCTCIVSSISNPCNSTTTNPSSGLTILTSYPRSGNTLLRSLIEQMTGVCSGTDTRPDRFLSKELAQKHNMVGEGVTSLESVHIVKTHFPERRGWKILKNPQRLILLTRNPYDAIDSYFHMSLTNSHTQTLKDKVAYEQFREFFEGLAISEMQTWHKFHEYWFQAALKARVPMLVVRYEDLLLRPHEAMARVIAFMLGKPLLSSEDRLDPFWRDRLFRVLGPSTPKTPAAAAPAVLKNEQKLAKLGSYQPRVGGGIGKSMNRFSQDLLERMHASCDNLTLLQLLQYDALTQDFPLNMVGDPPAVGIPNRSKVVFGWNAKPSCYGIVVNQGSELRPEDSIYGRSITSWRKAQTDNDANPLPTTTSLS